MWFNHQVTMVIFMIYYRVIYLPNDLSFFTKKKNTKRKMIKGVSLKNQKIYKSFFSSFSLFLFILLLLFFFLGCQQYKLLVCLFVFLGANSLCMFFSRRVNLALVIEEEFLNICVEREERIIKMYEYIVLYYISNKYSIV